jgi:hypothetical protein
MLSIVNRNHPAAITVLSLLFMPGAFAPGADRIYLAW